MTPRSCPLCESVHAATILELKAEAICAFNWTYAADACSILDVAENTTYPIRRCSRCGFIFAGFLPDASFLALLYERVIQSDECAAGSEHPSSHARRMRYVADLLELAPSPHRALDYGSGLGVTLRLLRACGVAAIGYDPSPSRRNYSNDRDVEVVETMEDVWRHAAFSMIVLDNVLEHLAEPLRAISLLGSMASPGSVAYVSVPSYETSMVEKQVEAQRRGQPLDMTLNPWEHLNYFSLAHLDSLMSRGGFVRILDAKLPRVEIGLRPEVASPARWKNAAASILRLTRYAATGGGVALTERAYYRRVR